MNVRQDYRSGAHLTEADAQSSDYAPGHMYLRSKGPLGRRWMKFHTQDVSRSDDEIRTSDIAIRAAVRTFALIFIVFDTHTPKDKD